MQWIYDELDTVYRINVFYLPELVIQPITGPEQVLLLDDLHSIFELLRGIPLSIACTEN